LATSCLFLAASFLFQCETTFRDTIEALRLIEQWKNHAEKRTLSRAVLKTGIRNSTPKGHSKAKETKQPIR